MGVTHYSGPQVLFPTGDPQWRGSWFPAAGGDHHRGSAGE